MIQIDAALLCCADARRRPPVTRCGTSGMRTRRGAKALGPSSVGLAPHQAPSISLKPSHTATATVRGRVFRHSPSPRPPPRLCPRPHQPSTPPPHRVLPRRGIQLPRQPLPRLQHRPRPQRRQLGLPRCSHRGSPLSPPLRHPPRRQRPVQRLLPRPDRRSRPRVPHPRPHQLPPQCRHSLGLPQREVGGLETAL